MLQTVGHVTNGENELVMTIVRDYNITQYLSAG